MTASKERIAVIGLGYVGLPAALAFARKFDETIGFDTSPTRIEQLAAGRDRNHETSEKQLRDTTLRLTASADELRDATFFVVAVPTPIDQYKRPDFAPLLSACESIGPAMSTGCVVVFESTVYPGATEEVCGPALARASGLECGVDFHLGYSPERINPGDREHTLERIVKVVSGDDEASLVRVADVYEAIIDAGVHRAPSIRVAEAAKVIENTQRDLNIALMNELSLIFDRLGISSRDVLAAARTKWNFLGFHPGLVGGHCIGVDPYYLTAKAEQLGYLPQVILAGRRINDDMGSYVAQRLVKLLIDSGVAVKNSKVGILGLTFKENVRDIRNSRVPDIIRELRQYHIEPIVHDPNADPEAVFAQCGTALSPFENFEDLDALVLAVAHREYMEWGAQALVDTIRDGGVVVDVMSRLDRSQLPPSVRYWSL